MNNYIKLTFTIIFSFITFNSNAQINSSDLKSREIANDVINHIFSKELDNKNYVIYSNSDKLFFVVVENQDNYKEYFISNEVNPVKMEVRTINKPNSLYLKMFNKSNYKTDYVTFKSEMYNKAYEATFGNLVYFAYHNLDGKTYGEFRLSIITKPSPIDKDINEHLALKVITYDFNSKKDSSITSDFTTAMDGWVANGAAQTQLENGKVKVTVDKAWEGIRREIKEFPIKAGDKLKVSVAFDKGTTNANNRIYFQELDASGKHLSWNVMDHSLKTGTSNYNYTVKAGTKLILRIDKTNTHENETTHFFVDQVSVSKK